MQICGAQGNSGGILDLHMQMRRRWKDAVEAGCICQGVSAGRRMVSHDVQDYGLLSYLTTSPTFTLPVW